jgi:hypothetical protein
MDEQGTLTTWLRLVIAAALATALGVTLGAGGASNVVQAAAVEPATDFEIDGNPSAPSDFEDPYGPGTTPGGFPTTGLYYNVRSYDNGLVPTAQNPRPGCDIKNDPSTGTGGVKLGDGPVWPSPGTDPNGKTDLNFIDVAAEKVNRNGEIFDIVYVGYEKCGGTGTWQTALYLDDGDGVTPSEGDVDGDYLFIFDFNPSSGEVTFLQYRRTAGAWTLDTDDNSAFIDGQAAADYGEVALNVTELVFRNDQGALTCSSIVVSGPAASITGGSLQSQVKDLVGFPDLRIDNCGSLDVTKDGPAAGAGVLFGYDVTQTDAGQVHDATLGASGITAPASTDEPDADLLEIDATIEIGQTHSWTNVLSSNDYDLIETLPDPAGGWAIDTIVCSYQDVFAAGYPEVDVTLYENGAPTGAEFAVPPNSIGGTPLEPADCVLTNDATGIVVAKETLPDGATIEFPFTVSTAGGDSDLVLADGESEFVTLPAGTSVTITEGDAGDSPSWNLTDIACSNEDGSEANVTAETANSVTLDVGTLDNTITCTFTNTQNGTITIDKTGVGIDAATTEFSFDVSGSPVGAIGIGGSTGPIEVVPGQYDVTEDQPVTGVSGYEFVLTDVTCDRSLGALTDGATVQVDPGAAVTCTFNNDQRGPVTIVKDAELVDPAPVEGTIDQFDVRYTVTATSESNVAEDITVVDAFDFPASLTVVGGPTVDGAAHSATWNGGSDTTLHSGSIAAGASLVWTIDVRVRLDLDAPTAERDCRAGGSGAWNDVSVSVDDAIVDVDDACVPFGDPTISVDKTVVGDVTVDVDATMSVTYQVDVANTGNGPGAYELTDELGFPSWVTVTGVVVSGPPGVLVDPAFDGDTEQAITTGAVGLGAGETDTYSITVTFTAAPTATDDGVACGPGVGEGLFNLASITSTSGPDDDDACTDIPRGRIVVTKATLGGTGVFDFGGVTLFDGVGLETGTIVTVTDDGTPSAPISAWVTPGGFALTETAPTGWTKIAEPCADITVADGQTVDCDFVNGLQGSITVTKVADPAGTFEFTFGPGGDVQDVASGGPGFTWSGLDAGDYSLTETVTSPWQLLSAACDGQPYTNAGPISVDWGQDITCTFSNEALAEIVISKTTDPGTDPVEIAFDFIGDLGAFSIGDGEEQSSGLVAAGTYSIAELVPAGWDLTGIECSVASQVDQPTGSDWGYGDDSVFDDGDTSAEIDLAAGDRVSCEFTNTQRGRIVVTKVIADGTATGDALLETFDFDLTGDFSTVEAFTLDGNGDDADGTLSTETFEVRPGRYQVTETVPADWSLDGAVCTDAQDPADLSVAPGATVACTFTNSPDPADVTIRKSVEDVASDFSWSFDFTITPDPDGDGGQDATKPAAGTGPTAASVGWTGLVPGQQYTIGETVPANWTQSGLVCVGLDDLDGDATNASVTFVAEPGRSLSCSVTNAPVDPTITIVKTTLGGTGTFDFEITPENDEDDLVEEQIATTTDGAAAQGTTYPLLSGLTYSVDELDPGAAWAEGALDCGDFGTAAPGAAVDITGQPGDVIVCEITNSALGNITVIKDTVGADGTFGFSIDDDAFDITTVAGTGQEDFQNLEPGTYVVTETDATAAFDGTALSCTSSNGDIEQVDLASLTATIDLSNGETVVCTFTNTERAHIVVDKTTNPSGSDALFTFTEDWTPVTGGSFQLADGDEPHDSGPIPSNTTYTLLEAPSTDWVVTSFVCTGGENDVVYDVDTNDADGASAAITPAPGETILCEVTNNRRGPVTVTKVADPAGVTRDGDVYTVVYDLTVGTESYIAEDFTLSDVPAFATGTTILTTTVTDAADDPVTLPLDGTIDPGETLVFTVTIELTIDGAVALADRDCAGTGTATFNAATVTYDVDPGTSSDDDCVDLPDPDVTVTKSAATDPTQPVYQGGNEYTVDYEIVVSNDGEGPASYTLVEDPDFGTGIDVTGISATSADGTVDPAFALGSLTLADGVDLQAGQSHTYTVTVTLTISADATLAARDCEGPGTATHNSVSLSFNGVDGGQDDDCVELPDPDITIDKRVSAGQPVHVSGNAYTVEYTVTVDNVGDGPGAYDLVDTPDFGAGATVTNVTVTGNGVDIDRDGDAPVTIVTGEPIDPDEAAHVYTVTVTFEVAGSMTTRARTCASGEERAGFGAYNGADVTYNGGLTAEADDCADIPEPDVSIIKSLDVANPLTRNADGTWTIGYLLTVSNATDAGPAEYDLEDVFDFPTGVTVDDVEVRIVGTTPDAGVLAAAFDGDGQPVVAADVRIDDGEAHVYRVLVDLTIAVVPGIDGSCAGDGGLVNTMSVSVRGDEPLTDDACDSFSTLTLVKQVVNDGGGTAGVDDFTLTATGPVTISGTTPVSSAVPAGTYRLSETQVDGYTTDGFVCGTAVPGYQVVVADGANVRCTIVNDDDPVADLAIVKTASVATTGPAGAFDWILTVTNDGPGAAVAVEVGDLVPASLTVGDVTSSFFTCSRSGNAVTCTRPTMAPGESGTITIAVTVNGAAVNGPIVNVGTVESSTPDPDLTNNSDDASVEVVVPLPPPPEPPPVTLPRTGSESTGTLVRSAMWLILLGGAVVLVTRRRRQDGTVTPGS